MLARVPTVRISFTIPDLVHGLITGWYKIYSQFPSKQQIGVLYAQFATETGLGQYCWNNNLGNIKAIDDPNQTIEYCALNGVWEIVSGKKIVLSSEDPGAWFRSFPTLDAGIEFYIGFLRTHRYQTAWTAVERGDPAMFGHLLKIAGYYTAPEVSYVNALQYHFNRFMQDVTFDNTLLVIQQEMNLVQFPTDYTPLTFDVKPDIVDRPQSPPSSTSWYQLLINKLRGFVS